MIPVSRSLTTLNPARQAALHAITDVEDALQAGRSLPVSPYVRAFLRHLAGAGRMNTAAAQAIPGLVWSPRNGQGSLKEVESALEELLRSQGERCPLPLPLAVRAELFPGVTFRTRTRRDSHAALKRHKAQRQEDNRLAREALLHQAQVGQARIDLRFSRRRRSGPGTPGGVMTWMNANWPGCSARGAAGLPHWRTWPGWRRPGTRSGASYLPCGISWPRPRHSPAHMNAGRCRTNCATQRQGVSNARV